MAATGSTNAVNHYFENFSSREWEDEAIDAEGGDASSGTSGAEKSKTAAHRTSAALRSSLTSLRVSSATQQLGNSQNPHPTKESGLESATGFVGSLLSGLANVVGRHRQVSPGRDVSPTDLSNRRSRRLSSTTTTVARLSSAATMRAELQNLAHFGDLRNDSFSSPASTKLRRRSSLLPRASDASSSTPTPPQPPSTFQSAASGDLSRHSTSALPTMPYIASPRLTVPGELPPGAAAAPAGFTTATTAPMDALWTSPQRTTRSARRSDNANTASSSGAAAAGTTAAGADCSSSTTTFDFPLPSPAAPLRAPSGPVPSPGALRTRSVTDMPRLYPSMSPHAPAQARPGAFSPSPAASSRSASTDHLPPMQSAISFTSGGGGGGGGPGSGCSVRDRPPTPRGRTSISGSPTSNKLSQVLGTFHLPDILTGGSGKSVTERRVSVSGGEGSVSRARRNSVSGPVVRASGGSFVSYSNGVLGPGGAAISASIAKRAAAAAAVAAAAAAAAVAQGQGQLGAAAQVPLSPGATTRCSSSSGGGALVMPSGISVAGLPRPSGPSFSARTPSATGRSPGPTGGILQDFQSSLELEADGALAAVDAEFDRRFRQSVSGIPAGGSQPEGVSIGADRQQSQQSQWPQPLRGLQPHAPKGERAGPAGLQGLAARRPNINVNVNLSPNPTAPSDTILAVGPVAPYMHTSRRQSCSAAMPCPGTLSHGMGVVGNGGGSCGGSGGGAGAGGLFAATSDAILLTSVDGSPSPACGSLNARDRLVSIRLSCLEGIVPCVNPHSESPGLGHKGGRRVSLDLPPDPMAKVPAAAWPQQTGAGGRLHMPAIATGAAAGNVL